MGPADLDLQALGLVVLFDRALVANHVEQQVSDAELLNDAGLAFGLHRSVGQWRGGKAQAQAGHGDQADETENAVYGNAPGEEREARVVVRTACHPG